MKLLKYIKLATLALGLTTATSASAGMIKFDYDTFSANSLSILLEKNGVSLSVTGWKWLDGSYVQANVIANNYGLGVVGGDDQNRIGNDDDVSLGQGDYLLFTSNVNFKALSIIFATTNSAVKLKDNEIAGLDIGFVFGDAFQVDASIQGSSTKTPLGFGIDNVYDNTFAIKSIGSGDGFKINSVAFNVPEPSSLAILGLGILAVVGRRMRKQA